jgi:hypothetical protein
MRKIVPIRDAAGIGYVLDRKFDMPPLMLTPDELALILEAICRTLILIVNVDELLLKPPFVNHMYDKRVMKSKVDEVSYPSQRKRSKITSPFDSATEDQSISHE